MRYDALNRPIQQIALYRDEPSKKINVLQPTYSEANLFERLDVWLDYGSPNQCIDPTLNPTSAVGVENIDYDAKGQRQKIDYKNGVSTSYEYVPDTYCLTRLFTQRDESFPGDNGIGFNGVQNLHYTYDAIGNITNIHDTSQQSIYFQNIHVDPSASYTYDALSQLIEATGREHLEQISGEPILHSYNDGPRVGLMHPNDANAMGCCLERYLYDAVGNMLSMQHRGAGCSG